MRVSRSWAVVLLLWLLPWLVLLVLGGWSLWQHQWWLYWLGAAASASGIGLIVARRLARRGRPVFSRIPEVHPDPHWPDTNEPAWQAVLAYAEQAQPEAYPLDDANPWFTLAGGTVQCVAQYFYPDSRHAELEIPAPQALRMVELVARDLRTELLREIPFSHVLTIGFLQRAAQTMNKLANLRDLFRVGNLAWNPAQALPVELRGALLEKLLSYPTVEIHRWLLRWYVKKIGFYAIQLYGGQLLLDDRPPTASPTPQSAADQARAAHSAAIEPLRILLIGQVNAGKSSLVNALFGELKAATDALPLTTGFVPYALEREGLGVALIYDSGGYTGTIPEWTATSREQLLAADLILLVSAANQAARGTDREALDGLRALYGQHPERAAPPILVAMTHIDQLRPLREWAPPYNIETPQRPKEQAIRAAMEVTAAELAVELADIVPVALFANAAYNVDDALHAAVLARLDDAHRAQYLRCLRHRQQREWWDHLYRQLANTGRLMMHATERLARR